MFLAYIRNHMGGCVFVERWQEHWVVSGCLANWYKNCNSLFFLLLLYIFFSFSLFAIYPFLFSFFHCSFLSFQLLIIFLFFWRPYFLNFYPRFLPLLSIASLIFQFSLIPLSLSLLLCSLFSPFWFFFLPLSVTLSVYADENARNISTFLIINIVLTNHTPARNSINEVQLLCN